MRAPTHARERRRRIIRHAPDTCNRQCECMWGSLWGLRVACELCESHVTYASHQQCLACHVVIFTYAQIGDYFLLACEAPTFPWFAKRRLFLAREVASAPCAQSGDLFRVYQVMTFFFVRQVATVS